MKTARRGNIVSIVSCMQAEIKKSKSVTGILQDAEDI